METGPRSQRASGGAGLAAYFYWLPAPSEWLRPCHHLGHCPLSVCLGEQGFRAEQWGARPGALNYRVRLSTAATGHTTHQMTHSETLQRGLRETSDRRKENIAGCLRGRKESGWGLSGQPGGISTLGASLPVTEGTQREAVCAILRYTSCFLGSVLWVSVNNVCPHPTSSRAPQDVPRQVCSSSTHADVASPRVSVLKETGTHIGTGPDTVGNMA